MTSSGTSQPQQGDIGVRSSPEDTCDDRRVSRAEIVERPLCPMSGTESGGDMGEVSATAMHHPGSWSGLTVSSSRRWWVTGVVVRQRSWAGGGEAPGRATFATSTVGPAFETRDGSNGREPPSCGNLPQWQ
jgi:hypothetical protein